jgi:nitroreductase
MLTVTGAFADDFTTSGTQDELSDQAIVSFATGDDFAQDGILKLIDSRVSTRTFSDKSIDDKTTDEILWAAFGINSRGTRTIPTSQNQQNLKVYAIRADGAFLYDGERLNKVSDADLRPLFARQDFVATAPLTLLFAGSDKDNSPLHAGSSYQNVALYCAERGLGNVVRAFFDWQAVEQALVFTEGEFAIISQTIGWKE